MAGLLLVLLLLSGCLHQAVVESLNARGVKSCVESLGFVLPFLLTHVVTATGGAQLEDCLALRLRPTGMVPDVPVPRH